MLLDSFEWIFGYGAQVRAGGRGPAGLPGRRARVDNDPIRLKRFIDTRDPGDACRNEDDL